MAKSKSFFGLRKGSTRDHTFYIQDGKQITRSRVEHVKNPRSRAQMVQRMVMTTAIAAYKCLKPICDHSWEGVEYGAKSFQRFMSLNTKILHAQINNKDTYFSYNRWHDNKSCSGEFQIADGTLVNYVDEKFQFEVGNIDSTNIEMSLRFTNEYMKPLTTANLLDNTGLSVGDTITFCFLVSMKVEKAKLNWLRMTILDETDIRLTQDVLEQHVKIESNADYNVDTNIEAGLIDFLMDIPKIGDVINSYYAMILSHKEGNTWQRTPARLILFDNLSGETSADDALATYPTAHNFILNGN